MMAAPDQSAAQPAADPELGALAGLAHVAAVAFLAARVAGTGGFFIALAGGVALARAAALRGLRAGFGTGIAATVQTVALLGPLRISLAATQVMTGPVVGWLDARGRRPAVQWATAAGLRALYNVTVTAFVVFVLLGGIRPYARTYNRVADLLPLVPSGTATAVGVGVAGILGWSAFASAVQVAVCRRALRSWPAASEQPLRHVVAAAEPSRRFDPRAVAVAAVISSALLLASADWALLGAVAAWLVAATAVARPDRSVLPSGAALAGLLALGTLGFSVIGGVGVDLAARRALRAGLLVAVATWLRAAAGVGGVHEVGRRVLARLGRVPGVHEGRRVLDALGIETRLRAAAGALLEALRGVPRQAVAIVDAVLGWVAAESSGFRVAPERAPGALAIGLADVALLVAAAAPAAALLAT